MCLIWKILKRTERNSNYFYQHSVLFNCFAISGLRSRKASDYIQHHVAPVLFDLKSLIVIFGFTYLSKYLLDKWQGTHQNEPEPVFDLIHSNDVHEVFQEVEVTSVCLHEDQF